MDLGARRVPGHDTGPGGESAAHRIDGAQLHGARSGDLQRAQPEQSARSLGAVRARALAAVLCQVGATATRHPLARHQRRKSGVGKHAPGRGEGLGWRRARVHERTGRRVCGVAPVRPPGRAARLARAVRGAARVEGAEPDRRVQGAGEKGAGGDQGGGATAPGGNALRRLRDARGVHADAAAGGTAGDPAAVPAAWLHDRGHAQLRRGRVRDDRSRRERRRRNVDQPAPKQRAAFA